MSCGCDCQVTAVETNAVVALVQVQLLAANPDRKNAVIQNIGSTVLQVHLTAGTAFNAGGTQWAQYGIWTAAQPTGVYKGAIYGIRGSGSGTVLITEEE
jgi:hypothetical protein